MFWLDKIHARHGYVWAHPVHEVLTWQGEGTEKRVTVEGMQLNHHADPEKSRAQYLPLLELSVREAPEDDRNVHYLGREYLFRGRWDDCIAMLKRHLAMPNAAWRDERCALSPGLTWAKAILPKPRSGAGGPSPKRPICGSPIWSWLGCCISKRIGRA